MEIKRTANAGVLLKLDGKHILLDGVCGRVEPYLPTPPYVRDALLHSHLDVLAFTHSHEDHYDAAFVSEYLQNAAGPILGPADIPFSTQETVAVGKVRITQISSHHIGKTGALGHHSFIIQGSRCVWFLGDASPLQWRKMPDLPKPDVLIAPYAYAIGSGWQISAQLAPDVVVLLHLPDPVEDPYSLWEAVKTTVSQRNGPRLLIPNMEETLNIL